MGEALITRRGGAPKFEEVGKKTYQYGNGEIWFTDVDVTNGTYYLTVSYLSYDGDVVTGVYLADSFIANGVGASIHGALRLTISENRLIVNSGYSLTNIAEAFLYKL